MAGADVHPTRALYAAIVETTRGPETRCVCARVCMCVCVRVRVCVRVSVGV